MRPCGWVIRHLIAVALHEYPTVAMFLEIMLSCLNRSSDSRTGCPEPYGILWPGTAISKAMKICVQFVTLW